MTPDTRLIKSYVWHGDKCFFVSTIDRYSSAALAPDHRYSETIAWEYDYQNRQRRQIVGMEECLQGSIAKHIQVCQQLHDAGEILSNQ